LRFLAGAFFAVFEGLDALEADVFALFAGVASAAAGFFIAAGTGAGAGFAGFGGRGGGGGAWRLRWTSVKRG